MTYRVSWRVPALTGEAVHSKEYQSFTEADMNLRDIAAYEGVTDARLDEVKPPFPVPSEDSPTVPSRRRITLMDDEGYRDGRKVRDDH